MNIAIIGAAGNLGTVLTRMAMARGHEVTAYVRNAERLAARLGPHAEAPQLRIEPGEVDDRERLARAMDGRDAVINTAGNVADEEAFSALVATVVEAAESALGPGGRFWLLGGAAALDVPGFDVRAAELPLVPKRYRWHLANYARVKATALDWSMLCPGPLLDAPDGKPHQGLRIAGDVWPTKGPGKGRFLATPRILSAFGKAVPEMTIFYEDAAQVILDNLARNGPFARKRVGVALPPGVTLHKTM